MIKCHKCGNESCYESSELWSPYGLHKLGLYKPETKTLLRCQKCNSLCYDKEEAEKRWLAHHISWDEAKKLYPEYLK